MSVEWSEPTIMRERLERVARSLDRPVSAFFDADVATTREAETLALVRVFDLIADQQTRARCIAFVSAQAELKQKNRGYRRSGVTMKRGFFF